MTFKDPPGVTRAAVRIRRNAREINGPIRKRSSKERWSPAPSRARKEFRRATGNVRGEASSGGKPDDRTNGFNQAALA